MKSIRSPIGAIMIALCAVMLPAQVGCAAVPNVDPVMSEQPVTPPPPPPGGQAGGGPIVADKPMQAPAGFAAVPPLPAQLQRAAPLPVKKASKPSDILVCGWQEMASGTDPSTWYMNKVYATLGARAYLFEDHPEFGHVAAATRITEFGGDIQWFHRWSGQPPPGVQAPGLTADTTQMNFLAWSLMIRTGSFPNLCNPHEWASAFADLYWQFPPRPTSYARAGLRTKLGFYFGYENPNYEPLAGEQPEQAINFAKESAFPIKLLAEQLRTNDDPFPVVVALDTASDRGWPVGSPQWYYLHTLLDLFSEWNIPVFLEAWPTKQCAYTLSPSVGYVFIENLLKSSGIDAGTATWAAPQGSVAGNLIPLITGHGITYPPGTTEAQKRAMVIERAVSRGDQFGAVGWQEWDRTFRTALDLKNAIQIRRGAYPYRTDGTPIITQQGQPRPRRANRHKSQYARQRRRAGTV